jgi:ABC-type transport system substrate-binding protein
MIETGLHMKEFSVTRRRFIGAGTAILGGAALAGPATSLLVSAQDATPAAATPVPGAGPLGGQIKMAYNTPATLNPLFSTTGTDQGAEREIYGALVMMTDGIEPEMDLAESVDVSADGKEYTFHLRKDSVFTDGVPLTSKDVIFTYTRAIDPRTASVWRSRLLSIVGADKYDGTTVTDIPGLQAPDDYTVKMTLTNPDATWLITLCDFAGFCILPEHAFGDIAPDQLQKANFTFNPTPSAGAFTFDQYQPDQVLSMKRNDNYKPPKANIDELFLTILPQKVTALSQLQSGDLDIVEVGIPDLVTVQGDPNLNVSSEPSVGAQFIVVNLTRPFFGDKRVRQAMAYAIDREAFLKEIMAGQGTIINSPMFGWKWDANEPDGLNPYSYDPDKAKQLLKEANWDGSAKIVAPYIPGDDPLSDTLSTIVQQQFKDVGINFDLLAVDIPDYVNRVVSGAKDGKTGDFDLVFGNGGVMGQDPNVTTKYFSTASATPAGSNYNHYSNPQVDDLLAKGRATTDVAERKAIYTQMAQILNDEMPWIYLWRTNAIYGVNKRVQNFKAPGHPGRVISSAHKWSVKQ